MDFPYFISCFALDEGEFPRSSSVLNLEAKSAPGARKS